MEFADIKDAVAGRIIANMQVSALSQQQIEELLKALTLFALNELGIDAAHVEVIDYLDFLPNGKRSFVEEKETPHVVGLVEGHVNQFVIPNAQRMNVGYMDARLTCYASYLPELKRLFFWRPYGDEFDDKVRG